MSESIKAARLPMASRPRASSSAAVVLPAPPLGLTNATDFHASPDPRGPASGFSRQANGKASGSIGEGAIALLVARLLGCGRERRIEAKPPPRPLRQPFQHRRRHADVDLRTE